MTAAVLTLPASAESVLEAGDRITGLLDHARQEAGCDGIPESVLTRLVDAVESLRSRLVHKVERDPRSLFDIDERLVDLLERAEEAAGGGEIPQELLQEMTDYLEAFRTKVDRITGYWLGAGRSRSRRSAAKNRSVYPRARERRSGE